LYAKDSKESKGFRAMGDGKWAKETKAAAPEKVESMGYGT